MQGPRRGPRSVLEWPLSSEPVGDDYTPARPDDVWFEQGCSHWEQQRGIRMCADDSEAVRSPPKYRGLAYPMQKAAASECEVHLDVMTSADLAVGAVSLCRRSQREEKRCHLSEPMQPSCAAVAWCRGASWMARLALASFGIRAFLPHRGDDCSIARLRLSNCSKTRQQLCDSRK